MARARAGVAVLGLHYPPEVSGNAPYTGGLARGLVERGVPVRVLTGYPHYPEWRVRAGYRGTTMREVIDGVPVVRLRSYVPRRPTLARRLLAETSFGFRLVFARWGRPETVLAVTPALFATALVALRARLSPGRTDLRIWVQDIYSLGLRETGAGGSRLGGLMARIESSTLRRANGIAVIHERFKRYLVEQLGVDPDRVTVLRNWTHLPERADDRSTPADRRRTRRALGWLDDDVIVLHAGNMGRKQALENVIGAARVAQARGSRVRFVLLGDGGERAGLERLAHGAEQLGFVDALPEDAFLDALRAADILLVNERVGVAEMSVPSKLTSYLWASRPIVAATDPGGVTAAEIGLSGAGIQVRAGDPEALLDVIERLWADPRARSDLVDHAIAYRSALNAEVAVDRFARWLRSPMVERT